MNSTTNAPPTPTKSKPWSCDTNARLQCPHCTLVEKIFNFSCLSCRWTPVNARFPLIREFREKSDNWPPLGPQCSILIPLAQAICQPMLHFHGNKTRIFDFMFQVRDGETPDTEQILRLKPYFSTKYKGYFSHGNLSSRLTHPHQQVSEVSNPKVISSKRVKPSAAVIRDSLMESCNVRAAVIVVMEDPPPPEDPNSTSQTCQKILLQVVWGFCVLFVFCVVFERKLWKFYWRSCVQYLAQPETRDGGVPMPWTLRFFLFSVGRGNQSQDLFYTGDITRSRPNERTPVVCFPVRHRLAVTLPQQTN